MYKRQAKGFLIVGLLVGTLLTANEGMFSAIKNLFSKVFEVFKQIVGIVVEKVLPVFAEVLTIIVDAISAFLPPIMDVLAVIIDVVMEVVQALMPVLEIVINAISAVLSIIAAVFQGLVDSGIIDALVDVVYGFINIFIGVWNGIIEGVAMLASLFGKGDEVRALKVDYAERDQSDEKAAFVDFSMSDEQIDKQIDAQLELGNLNKTEAAEMKANKDKFKEQQEDDELEAAKKIYEMAEKQNIEAGSSEVTVQDQDGTPMVLMSNFKSIDGWRHDDEYLVDKVPNDNGSFNMYDPETMQLVGRSHSKKGGATPHIIANLAVAQKAKDEMEA